METGDCSQGRPLLLKDEDVKFDAKNVDRSGKKELETSLGQACAVIQAQSEALQDLRNQANTDRTTSLALLSRVEVLTKDLDALRTEYSSDHVNQKSEIKRLTDLLEVRHECNAQANDEIRFQILGIRSRLDPSKHRVSAEVLRASVTSNGAPGHHHHNNNKEGVDQGAEHAPLLASPRPPLNHQAEIVWRIGGFTRKLKKIKSGSTEDPFISDAFTTGPFGYRMSVWAYLNGRGKGSGNCVSLYVRVTAGEFDPILKWPVRPCYTFVLLDQVANPLKRADHVRVRDLTAKPSGVDRPKKEEKSVIVGFDDFITQDELMKHRYLVDDSLFIRVVADIHE